MKFHRFTPRPTQKQNRANFAAFAPLEMQAPLFITGSGVKVEPIEVDPTTGKRWAGGVCIDDLLAAPKGNGK